VRSPLKTGGAAELFPAVDHLWHPGGDRLRLAADFRGFYE